MQGTSQPQGLRCLRHKSLKTPRKSSYKSEDAISCEAACPVGAALQEIQADSTGKPTSLL